MVKIFLLFIVNKTCFNTQEFFFLGWLNTYRIHNHERLLQSVYHRDRDRGLVTISNHESCIDDPLLWGKDSRFCKETTGT